MCLALVLFSAPAVAQQAPAAREPDLRVIARQMVRDVARVRAGDNVFITGDVRDMEMLEHLAIEVRKLGAAAVIILGHHNAMSGREEFQRRLLDEVPADHDDKNLPLELKLWQLPNVHIYFGGRELPDLFRGVPARRFTTYEKVRQALEGQFARRNVRRVLIDLEIYPTAAVAKKHGMTREQLAAVFWRAMAADPATIRTTADAVRATLA